MLKKQVFVEVFNDINVMIVIRNFNQKEDQIRYQKSSLESISKEDKY